MLGSYDAIVIEEYGSWLEPPQIYPSRYCMRKGIAQKSRGSQVLSPRRLLYLQVYIGASVIYDIEDFRNPLLNCLATDLWTMVLVIRADF